MVLWPGFGTKGGEASHVRRSDRLLKPQLRCALHSVTALRVAFCYCATRLHSFCFLAGCRFANCAICSLVAGFALMVYLRISLYYAKMPLTHHACNSRQNFLPYFTIVCWRHGRCCNSFEQPIRLLRDYRGSGNYFLRITQQRPSTGHYQRRADCGHNQQNHGTNNRRLQRLSRLTWWLTRRSK